MLRRLAIGLLMVLVSSVWADSNWQSTVPYTTGVRLVANEPVEGGVMYTRLVRLAHSGAANGRLVATYEHFPNNFIIYRSDDDGLTWQAISTVQEVAAGWIFEGEPHLYELPQAVDNLPAGTLLLAGSSIHGYSDGHYRQRLEVFYSLDQGVTWTYRGCADESDGYHGGIWEPNLQVAANGKLVMYYSDERQVPKYNQILAERVSEDGGKTWGSEQMVVGVPDGVQRPGMAVTQRMANGTYVMSYEWVNPNGPNPVRIRFSNDGINWGSPTSMGIPVQASNGSYLASTPYLTWLPAGGPKGTLVVSGATLVGSPNNDREIFINTNLGQGPWVAEPSPVQWQGGQQFDGWSMGMIPTADGTGIIQMAPSYAGNNVNEVLIARTTLIWPGQNYVLSNQNSGLVMGISGNSFTHGTFLQQVPNDLGVGQTWTFTDLGNERFAITNPFTGLAVDDYAWATALGSAVAVWDINYFAVQQWQPMPVGNGYLKLRNINSGLVIGVLNATTSPGGAILQWSDNFTLDHNWQPLASPYPATVGLFVNPSSVLGGSGATALLSTPSASSGGSWALVSSSARVSVPTTVAIPLAARQAVVPVKTQGVDADTVVKLTASGGGASLTSSLTVRTANLSSATASTASLVSGSAMSLTFALDGPAGPRGKKIVLTSSQPTALPVPASALVAADQVSTTVALKAGYVTTPTTVTVTVQLGSVTKTLIVHVQPIVVTAITATPNPVVAGGSLSLTVTLNGKAASTGTTVALTGSAAALAVPTSVTVPSGAVSVTKTLVASGVDTDTTVTIGANLNGGAAQAVSVKVLRASLLRFTAASATLKGGTAGHLYVTLNGPAGPSGLAVGLSADAGSVAVPASATVAAGSRTLTVAFTTRPVTAKTLVTVTATVGGASIPFALTLTP